jgi:hypothetical protein
MVLSLAFCSYVVTEGLDLILLSEDQIHEQGTPQEAINAAVGALLAGSVFLAFLWRNRLTMHGSSIRELQPPFYLLVMLVILGYMLFVPLRWLSDPPRMTSVISQLNEFPEISESSVIGLGCDHLVFYYGRFRGLMFDPLAQWPYGRGADPRIELVRNYSYFVTCNEADFRPSSWTEKSPESLVGASYGGRYRLDLRGVTGWRMVSPNVWQRLP